MHRLPLVGFQGAYPRLPHQIYNLFFVLFFYGLWLCSGFPQSWSCFRLAVVVKRLPPILFLAFLDSGFAQDSVSLGLAFAGLWLCTGFSWSLSFLCWAVFFLQDSPVLFFPLLGCGYAQDSPSLCLAFDGLGFCSGFLWSWSCPARLWLCIGFPWYWSCLCWSVVVPFRSQQSDWQHL